jgi:ribosomal protein S18 acetylase RimI-like enzyme
MSVIPSIGRMRAGEAEELNHLFVRIVEALPYYNNFAKRSEIAKYSPESLRDLAEKELDSVLVARVDDQIVGFCFSESDDGLVWLAWFGVDPLFRRHGVGAQLLEKLEETVRNGRSHKIWCDCRTENEASKVALTKRGYIQLCTVRNHWYGQDFILWEKSLA